MYLTTDQFTVYYVSFLLLAVFERVTNTFYQKKTGKTVMIYYKWSFIYLFYSYLIIVFVSIAEYFTKIKLINLKVVLLGLIIYGFGIVIRRKAIKELGEYWSVYIEIKKEHKLIKSGIYKRLKHPYCLAVIAELVGICLVANSYNSLFLVFLIQLPLLFVRINLEEMVLRRHFGTKY